MYKVSRDVVNLGFVLCIADHCCIFWNIQFRKKKINLFNQVLPFFLKIGLRGFLLDF